MTEPEVHPSVPKTWDSDRVRADFPILQQEVQGHPLVYLDSAASSQKPTRVIEAMDRYYRETHSNVHRGVHTLSQRATALYEGARETTRSFLNAASTREIVFVRGTTEAINLVAYSYGESRVGEGDEVIVTTLEHHSNIVPWQLLCQRRGAKLRVVPIDDRGVLIQDEYEALLNERTRIVALGHVSNALGTINPVAAMIEKAHDAGAVVLLDGAQSLPHMAVDVQELNCDFFAFSAHKAYGPTGIGALYARESLLAEMPPWQGGGDMISRVSFEESTWNVLPHRFEAGTPDIAGAIGMAEAFEYLNSLGLDAVAAHEAELLDYGSHLLGETEGVKLIGTGPERAGAISFLVEGVHPHDVGTILDGEGIAIRAGHHCAQPVMDRFGIAATVRASLGVYNTTAELDALVSGLKRVREIFG